MSDSLSKAAYLALQMSVLYPKVQLPAQKNAWTMGHRCLAWFDKTLPLHTLLLPSLYMAIADRMGAGLCPKPDIPVEVFIEALNLANERMAVVRPQSLKRTTMDLIKQNEAANCFELANLACAWLQNHGVNACVGSCSFYRGLKKSNGGHNFVIFHTGRKKMPFRKMARNLDNPQVHICDIWFGKSAQASEMLNEYSRFFVAKDFNDVCIPLDGYEAVLTEEDHSGDVVCVGRVERNGDNFVRLYDKPESFINGRRDLLIQQIDKCLKSEGR